MNTSLPARQSLSPLAWILIIVAVVDIVLVVASGIVAMGSANRITNQLNLGLENNAAVWWSSATLLVAALLFFDSAFRHATQRTALIIISMLLVFLSLDEMGSLHERIFTGSYWSYVPYGLGGGLLFLYAFWQLYKDESLRPIATVIFIGFSCFGSVVAQEFFEHNVDWPAWAVGLRVAVEEGTELLGTGLCLLAAGRLLGFDQADELKLPHTHTDARPFLIAITFVAVCAGTYAAVRAPGLSGYPVRGNPALWFAMAGFLYLVYEVLRGEKLLTAVFQNPGIIVMGVFASLAQTMFVYTKFDLMYLVAIDIVLFAGIVLLIVRRNTGVALVAGVAGIVLLVLGYFALQGSAVAAFVLSFAAALVLIFIHRKARLN